MRVAAPALVLDTNIWLDLYVFEDASVAPLRAALDAGTLVALRNPATDAELPAVLSRAHFLDRCPPARATQLLQHWTARAQEAQITRSAPWHCRDPQDQKFLDLAYSGGAAALLTKDRALLALARKALGHGLRIATPRDYPIPAA